MHDIMQPLYFCCSLKDIGQALNFVLFLAKAAMLAGWEAGLFF